VFCAEMFVSQGRPLRQVMRLADLAEGKFFVNWDTHQVYVHLPSGADPNQVSVEAVRGRSWLDLKQANAEG